MTDPTFLQILWFVLIAVLWTGYLVLEGFDFGVGMLLPFLAKDEKERRVMINTVGPHWDGNEVWVLTAGGATFAAFPEWYATLFSGAYLVLFLILLAFIARIVAFEWRGKISSPGWQKSYYWGLVLGSWVPAILWGAAFGNLVAGMKLDFVEKTVSNVDGEVTRQTIQYVGNFFDLLLAGNGFALLSGVAVALIFLVHGAIFLSMKTTGDLQKRSADLAAKLAPVLLVGGAIWALWLQFAFSDKGFLTLAIVVLAAVLLLAIVMFTRARAAGRAFVASVLLIVGVVGLIFTALYPNVIPSSLNADASLTIMNASSSPYTLTMMTWVAVIFVPIVLAYQSWSYIVFRKRIGVANIPPVTEVTFDNANAGVK
jgi:cytochrome d ubiquinol oxidase subunit II